jgi:lipopolysaccharide exporter
VNEVSAQASLGVRATRGAAALAVASAASQGIALATSLVLARLLGPEDFGLVALANLLLAFVGPLHDSGLATAFVARDDRAREYAATLGWGTALSGLVAGALVAASAPLMAAVFDTPALVGVTRALAVTFAFRGIAAAPLAVLTRELAFERRAATVLAGGVTESMVSIGFALRGAGPWALVAGQLGGAVATAAAAWIVAPWWPRGRFSATRLWEMSRYGRHVVLGNSLGFLGSYLDNIVVGRALGTAALGVYGAAFRWGRMPALALSMVVSPVAFPSYVSVRDDPARLQRAYLRLVRTVTSIAMPAQMGLLLIASRFVETLYPPAWHDMVTPLRIFAVFGLVNSIVGTTGDVFKAANRPGWIAAIGGIHLPTLLIALWLLVGRGPGGAAAALTIAALASGAVAVPLALRVLALSPWRLVAALGPQALATAVMVVVVAPLDRLLPPAPSIVALAATCGAGAFAYLATLMLVDGRFVRELAETLWLTLDRRGIRSAASVPLPPSPRSSSSLRS